MTAIIEVAATTVLEKGNFRGLYLAVFSRENLALVFA